MATAAKLRGTLRSSRDEDRVPVDRLDRDNAGASAVVGPSPTGLPMHGDHVPISGRGVAAGAS